MATTSDVRRLNQHQVVLALQRIGRASRAELAKITQMSAPTVGRIVDDLLGNRILRAAAVDTSVPEVSVLGRPSQMLELDRLRKRFAMIQLGVKRTRLAMLPVAVPSSDTWDLEFPTPDNLNDWLNRVADTWDRLPVKDIELILMGTPGVVDEATGQVLLSPNLRWSEGAKFPELLAGIGLPSGVPIHLVQEIRALARGQMAVFPELRDFLQIDFGNGMGGAAMINGQLFSGALALSCELGHTPVLGNTRTCGCGSVGCVETLISRDGLIRSATEAVGHVDSWDHLVRLVKANGIAPWITPALDATAVAIAGALNVLGLQTVVLTGSVNDLGPIVGDYLSSRIKSGAMWGRFGQVNVVTAAHHRSAGLVANAVDVILGPAA